MLLALNKGLPACFFCGKSSHPTSKCNLADFVSFSCGGSGHRARNCRLANRKTFSSSTPSSNTQTPSPSDLNPKVPSFHPNSPISNPTASSANMRSHNPPPILKIKTNDERRACESTLNKSLLVHDRIKGGAPFLMNKLHKEWKVNQREWIVRELGDNKLILQPPKPEKTKPSQVIHPWTSFVLSRR